MDTALATILAAVMGALIAAIVAHFRSKADWREMNRTIQRDAAGDLLTAADNLSWELVIGRNGGTFAATSRQSVPDPQLVVLTQAQRRLDAEIRRAHVVITDPEARAAVASIHAAVEGFLAELRGGSPVAGVEWAERFETSLDRFTDQLQAISERNLKPGGPDRRPLIRWNQRKSGHAAGGDGE